jgi:hypothetical protein
MTPPRSLKGLGATFIEYAHAHHPTKKPGQSYARCSPHVGLRGCLGFRLLIGDTPKLGPWLLPDLRH